MPCVVCPMIAAPITGNDGSLASSTPMNGGTASRGTCGGSRHTRSGLQQPIQTKPRARLARRLVGECELIPVPNRSSRTRRNEGAEIGVPRLQRGVAAAMVAMQVRVDQRGQPPPARGRFDQLQGLGRVRDIPAVHERGIVHSEQDHIVRRQPPTLENAYVRRQRSGRGAHAVRVQCGARSSRRRILPTFVFGSSSRNSMYFGTL